eukprot:15360730-Ditylum_brightwellii.AAC.1
MIRVNGGPYKQQTLQKSDIPGLTIAKTSINKLPTSIENDRDKQLVSPQCHENNAPVAVLLPFEQYSNIQRDY